MVTAWEGDPWDQQPGETSRAYEAFRAYRDLGPSRVLTAVPARIGSVRGWSNRYQWQERVRAWDTETWRLEDARRLEQIRDMADTHQQLARGLIRAGLAALQAQQELTPNQAARYIALGTELQRKALTGKELPALAPPDLSADDELSPLERIARELAGTA